MMTTELQKALQAMSQVVFTDMDPALQVTMGSFLERALTEVEQREELVRAREETVSKREADVQVREDRAEKQMAAIASAQRLQKRLGFVEVVTAKSNRWLRRA